MLIYCRPKLKSDFLFQNMCSHINFTHWVQSGKCCLRKTNHKPRTAIHAVSSTFSPATRRISTWDLGSPSKGRDSDQNISSSWRGDLTAYLWRAMDRDSNLSHLPIHHRYPYIYNFVIHFVRNIWPHFPASTILEARTNSVLLRYAIYKYFLQ